MWWRHKVTAYLTVPQYSCGCVLIANLKNCAADFAESNISTAEEKSMVNDVKPSFDFRRRQVKHANCELESVTSSSRSKRFTLF